MIHKSTFFTLFLSIILVFELSAQTNPFAKSHPSHNGVTRCLTDELAHQEYNNNPAFRQAVDQSKSMNNNNAQAPMNMTFSDSVVRIPVVFHVIHNNGAENISLAQIESQIRILNEDFRRIPGTPGFGTGVDTKIEFFLAQRDPNGNCSDGVVRVASTLTQHSPASAAQLKALSQWDPNRYLNFWVVDDMGGVLGYATFPTNLASSPQLDGIVCADQYVGDIGTSSGAGPYGLGRTATHEIGHWLWLYHTFQGGCVGMNNSTCSSQGDEVCDTPPVASPNFGCPIGANSCAENITELGGNAPDQVENYMDYSDDPCFNKFTAGQSNRMNQALQTYRPLLLDSMNAINAGYYGCFTINYCTSAGNDSSGTQIRNVSLGTLNNSTPTNCKGYSDFKTSSFPTLTRDSSYVLSVTTGHCSSGTTPNHEVKAYIDWDRNGSFTDTLEEYLVKANGPSGTGTVTITVPSNAPLDVTGMRIIASDSFVIGPCGIYPFGETEDYAIKIQAPPPVITSFSPTSGPVSQQVFIVGQNFTGATEVKFNNTGTNFFTVLSDDTIRVNVPFGSTTGPITVTSPTGSDISAGIFTVTTPAPTITNFNPQTGPVGTSVVIFGQNLGTVSQVWFNGTAVTNFNQNGNQINTQVPPGATTGKIELQNAIGIAQSANNFTVTFAPIAAAISGNTTICDGASANLNFNLSGTPPFNVVYTDGTNNFNLNLNTGTHVETVTPGIGSTTYTIVSVIDQNDTVTAPDPAITGSATVVVNPKPGSASLTTASGSICENDTAQITINITGGTAPYDIEIDNGVGQLTGINNGHVINVTPASTRTYALLNVKDNNNCGTSNFTSSATVNIIPGPDADFNSAINKSIVTFTDLSTGAVSWSWSFGDSTTSTQQNPIHTYSFIGIKNVRLTSTNADGCTDTRARNILILEVSGIEGLLAGEDLNIFPNPAEQNLNVELSLNKAVKLNTEIVGIDGKQIMSESSSRSERNHRINLDVHDLSPGMYILKFTLSDGRSLNTRFFKQ